VARLDQVLILPTSLPQVVVEQVVDLVLVRVVWHLVVVVPVPLQRQEHPQGVTVHWQVD
jgi:hypothetical protein